MNYSFSIISPTDELWKSFAQSSDCSVFFTKNWNEYLRYLGRKAIFIEISSGEEVIGCFVGSTRWLGVRVITAPPMGTGTYSQGLCLYNAVSQIERIEIYCQLANWLFSKQKIGYFQVCDWLLRSDDGDIPENHIVSYLKSAGVHFQSRTTYYLDLRFPEEELWKRLHYKSCKYAINKAQKEGLSVRVVNRREEIDAFVDQHRSHVVDVLRRKKNKGLPCQSRKYISALCHSLFPDNVLMLQVVGHDEEGKEVSMSSGVFAFNEGVSTYYTAGSYQQFMHYCPNELMVWEAMRLLHEKGVKELIFGGIGHYKKKFGSVSTFVPVLVFSRYRFLLDFRRKIKIIYQKAIHIIHP